MERWDWCSPFFALLSRLPSLLFLSPLSPFRSRTGEMGTGPISLNGPQGAARKLDLSRFPPP